MRNIFLSLMLALSLAGCATFKNIETAVQLGTASIANPVTPTRLSQMENATILVFTGLNTWKASCAKGLIPPSCKNQIFTVQIYTRQIPPFLIRLRAFVKNNDQVNAVVVFNQLVDTISAIKAQAAASGQTIGS